ncbi:MAG: tRNA pseudouridine(55) synthase TruB [Mariniblastus sp.]
MFGFLNIDKAIHKTSRDAVNVVQRIVRPSKIGHAGTLDPLATGVLAICVGPSTRLIQYLQRSSKTYLATFEFGLESDTEDKYGTLTQMEKKPISQSDLESVLPEFVGKIEQMPPKFSAIKVNGQRAYDLARKGKTVVLKARPVSIYQIELKQYEYPNFQLEICCGTGTYIRSLGRDIARRLETGAVMTKLQRTKIGDLDIADAVQAEDLTIDNIESHLIAPQGVLDLKVENVPNDQLARFVDGHHWETDVSVPDDELMAVDDAGRLQAILKRREAGLYTPKINFSKYWAGQAS